MFDRDVILTYFAYFLDCLPLLSTHIKSPKSAHINYP